MQVEKAAHKSHLTRNLVVVVIVALLIVGAGIAYSYSQLSGQVTNVSYGGIVWARPTAGVLLQLVASATQGDIVGIALTLITGIDINAQLSVTNGGVLSVTVPSETHHLTVNGVDLGAGSTRLSMAVNPGQTVNIPVKQTIKIASFSQLGPSIVASGGNLKVQINGQLHFSVLGLPLSIPFQKTSQISLLKEIEQHVQSLISGQSSNQQSNQYNGNPPSSGGVIVNAEYKVSPGHYVSIPFTLNSATTVTGSFSATATLGNNIIVYVFDQNNFAAYKNGQASQAYYISGKVASGSINLKLGAGTYYLVLDNTYSTVSTKDVSIQVSSG